MAGYEWQVQESSSWSAHEAGCLSWSLVHPKEVGSNANERIDFLARGEQAGREQKLPSCMSLYRLPAEDMAQIRGFFFNTKDLD